MRTTRRKTKGGDIVHASRYNILPGITLTQRKKKESLQQPVQPYHILAEGEQEFDLAIATAPRLKELKSKLSSYYIHYLKKALRSFSYDESHQAYTSEKKDTTCFVYVASQLVKRLQNEIEHITNNSESLGYAFSSDNSAVIIEELNTYIKYIERNATPGLDRINTDFITTIFN